MSGKSEVHETPPFAFEQEFVDKVKDDTVEGIGKMSAFVGGAKMPLGFFLVIDNYGGMTSYWCNLPPGDARSLLEEALRKLESPDAAEVAH